MKGGKAGRQRQAAASRFKGKPGTKKAPKVDPSKGRGAVAPPKGTRIKTFGGRSSNDE